MSARQLQVNLLFQANTQAAINNIQQLSATLNQIGTKTTIGVDGGALQRASQSAQELQMHLSQAVNVNTGKLDLTKFNASLNQSKTSLQTHINNLQAVGPTGQQAFLKLATAIASAEAPMLRVNQRLRDFGTTLLNTVKWQLASTAIHSVGSMLSSAVSHAEDLNKALNDIRIVTGKGTAEMYAFTQEATYAARALSTTTTEYAKAALIFYQQGLDGSAVTDRADVVIKLAQVTGQSAETVSSQMTAIWNNFDDGTETLEYYADVLTKLGAATAASTDEISQGLEKFAAVAETVGLSYEYAAASVATVVDKTRQSADVVGTAFKTIFARMEGLSLGETLEDGVDLNKYSEALASVGVNILDTSGQLKSMDTILNELGDKWQYFGQETKVALAQTVGGIRQYNQMLALMENWDAVEDNIMSAKNATGELTKQQSIWSESYEAAAQRVKQAKNELFENFLDDSSIVKLMDMFAGLIDGVTGFIDSLGGVGPMVLMLVAIFNQQLFPLIQRGFTALISNIGVLTGKAQYDIARIQSQAKAQLQAMMEDSNFTAGQKQQLEVTQKLLDAKKNLTIATKNMTEAQRQEAQARMANYEAIATQTQATLEKKAALEEEIRLMKEAMNTGASKRQIAETAVLGRFRDSLPEDSTLDADAVVEDATTTSISHTEAELAALPTDAQNEQRRFEINEKIKSTMQSIADLERNLANTSEQNTERQESTKKKIEEQYAVLQKLEDEMESIGEEDVERRKHLQAVLELQKQISAESKKDVSKISAGTMSNKSFGDTAHGRGTDVV